MPVVNKNNNYIEIFDDNRLIATTRNFNLQGPLLYVYGLNLELNGPVFHIKKISIRLHTSSYYTIMVAVDIVSYISTLSKNKNLIKDITFNCYGIIVKIPKFGDKK